jgi:hypothetical protein
MNAEEKVLIDALAVLIIVLVWARWRRDIGHNDER